MGRAVSRSLSSTFRQALYAQQTGEVVAVLMTFTHPDLADPIRLSTDPTQRLSTSPEITYGTVSRGDEYTFVPIAVVLSGEDSESAPQASLEIDNTSLDLINLVRSLTAPATAKLEIVLASDPDTVEISFPAMTVGSADYDENAVRFRLEVDGLFSEPFPGTSFSPSMFPGLFGGGTSSTTIPIPEEPAEE